MNQRRIFRITALLALVCALSATELRAANDPGALMSELSQQVRQHGEKFARCVDNTAARHALNATTPPETAAAASVEDCEGVLRVLVVSCSENIRALCENFAKEMRTRELKRAAELIERLRLEKK